MKEGMYVGTYVRMYVGMYVQWPLQQIAWLFTVILQCNIEVFQFRVLTLIYSISVLLISAKK
jgi:hypothetical protein